VRLRLPAVLAAAVLGSVAVAACDGDGAPDAFQPHYFCFQDSTLPDAGPGQPDANPCGQVVTNPNDCPPGCTPVG